MAKLTIPQFWYSTDKNGTSPFMAKLLWPLSQLYHYSATINRILTIRKKSPLPVICIGNLTMGGAGKTPTSRAILKLILEHGKFATPCFLMRGYGGNHSGPVEVDLASHTSWDVGDEALMQAHYAPTIVSKNRYKGAKLARELGYDIIIMDDGFQNAKLAKDLPFVVIDGGFGFGNGHVFPSGPLREPIKNGCRRACAAIVINKQDDIDLSALNGLKQFNAAIKLENHSKTLDNKKVVAFAGIARPEKFFDTLESNGYHVHSHHGFPDHHIYTHGQLQSIVERAEKYNANIITTEKDWVRLSSKWHNKISYLKISIQFTDEFKQYLFKRLDRLFK